jgi:hypothetical protein
LEEFKVDETAGKTKAMTKKGMRCISLMAWISLELATIARASE